MDFDLQVGKGDPPKPRLHKFRVAYLRWFRWFVIANGLLLAPIKIFDGIAVTSAQQNPIPDPQYGKTFHLVNACNRSLCGTGYVSPWLGKFFLFEHHWLLWWLALMIGVILFGLWLRSTDPEPDDV